MNLLSFADLNDRIRHRLRFYVRVLDRRRHAPVFSYGSEPDALRRIYVINLDRKPDRWRRVQAEINRFRERHGRPLGSILRRFSAVDARYLKSEPDSSVLIPTFTLADQLTVSPSPLVSIDEASRRRIIRMTEQEMAVALSHIEVWRLVADGNVPNALVLEDDVFMPVGFVDRLQTTWAALSPTETGQPDFDLLYLAYKEVGEGESSERKELTRRSSAGLWEASGYVLTRSGAQALLDLLPVCGPVDLWLNLQFGRLRVYTAAQPIIEQRLDEPSTNSYSVLPVLSQIGVIAREKPLVPASRRLAGPVIGIGSEGSGLTALGKALSMLGYTCCSDLDELPFAELEKLVGGRKSRVFNAYVNIGSISGDTLATIVKSNSGALVIATSVAPELPDIPSEHVLHLSPDIADKWDALTTYLGLEYPSFPYPNDEDRGQCVAADVRPLHRASAALDLKADRSPWSVPAYKDWKGLRIQSSAPQPSDPINVDWSADSILNRESMKLRDDTFPSNLALFRPANFVEGDRRAHLVLQKEATPVRDFTAAAIASRDSYLYGSFGAELRPPKVSGLITGVFLHRNGPRQEIDIEILGKDPTKMLVNVYYNPGPIGTKLEFGYRGTPTLVELGFDASADTHMYEIEWQPNFIRWKVDGDVVYERVVWNPTPIPDQPLEFNVNLWHSRSTEFAGRLAEALLPAHIELRSIQTNATSTLVSINEQRSAFLDTATPNASVSGCCSDVTLRQHSTLSHSSSTLQHPGILDVANAELSQ